MVVGPELDEGVWAGVFQPGLAKSVEGGDGGLLRLCHNAVDGLLAVDVGFMLEVAAEGVADRRQHKAAD